MFGWLKPKTSSTKPDLVEAFGIVLERHPGFFVSSDVLPAPKDEIRTAFVSQISAADNAHERDLLGACFLALASFQPMTARERAELEIYEEARSAVVNETDERQRAGAMKVLLSLEPTHARFRDAKRAELEEIRRQLASLGIAIGSQRD
jgi:hypothetical protein